MTGAVPVVPAALWRTGLLLSLLSLCAAVEEEECVLGIVGRTVSLPCVQPHILPVVNSSIEWRRGEEVVLRSEFTEDGDVEEWSINRAQTPADAARTGNFSLQLPAVDPTELTVNYSLIIIFSGGNRSTELCTVCLRTAATFSFPLLKRDDPEDPEEGEETSFLCLSSGGFPEPVVSWLINNTEEPPEGSVRTLTRPLPDSLLYNVSSQLKVNISRDTSVSCTIGNPSMNTSWTTTNYGSKSSPVVSRASEAMWIFSTSLCVVIGVLVLVGVAYQIHLDRMSKKKKKQFQKQQQGYKRRPGIEETETEELKTERIETDV